MVKKMENPIKNGWFGGTTIFGNIQYVFPLIVFGIQPNKMPRAWQNIMMIYDVHISIVGGWTKPIEKYDRQNGFIFPNFRGETTKKLFETNNKYIFV